MARYNLIMSDENYMKLMQIAVDRGITMGRLLNDIIQKECDVRIEGSDDNCMYCDQLGIYKTFKDGKPLGLMCEHHFHEHKKALSGWKVIE